MKIYGVMSVLITLLLPSAVIAQNTTLEQGLLTSMSVVTDSENNLHRNDSSGQAIQAYMRQNYINKKPNFRFDYTDYYLLNKPALLLGHELKVIEEEYMSAYIGCCVSPGVGAVIRQKGSLDRLKDFAKKNRCSIEPINFNDYLKDLNIRRPNAPSGNYYAISCRERELYRDD